MEVIPIVYVVDHLVDLVNQAVELTSPLCRGSQLVNFWKKRKKLPTTKRDYESYRKHILRSAEIEPQWFPKTEVWVSFKRVRPTRYNLENAKK